MEAVRGIEGKTIQVAWVQSDKYIGGQPRGRTRKVLMEVVEHRSWGGTRAIPDTYDMRFVWRTDKEKYGSIYQDTYPTRPYDLFPVGKYTLNKLNKIELSSHKDYRNEWVTYYA